MKQKHKKQGIRIRQSVIIIVSLLTLMFVFSRFITKHATSPTTIPPEPTAILTLTTLAQTLEVKPTMRDSIYWNWVDEEENILPLNGKEFFIGSVNINGIGKYPQIEDSDIEKVTLQFLQPIATVADEFFIKQGFTKSAVNTTTVPDELENVYGGYEKGSLKCRYSLTEHSDPFGRFFCGHRDYKQEALQKEFASLFPLVPTKGKQPPLLRIEKVVGNYALGNYADGVGPGGFTFMARKTNDTWEVVWRGTEIAVCSEMKKYQIPKEIYGECYPDQ